MQYYRTYQKLGLKGLAYHLFVFRQIKEGTLVGIDRYGNKYYENTELPYGQHRWYEPKIPEAQNLHDASSIPPEWHGWMHCSTDRIPDQPLPTGPAIVEQSNVPKNLDTHQVPESVRKGFEWRPNPTLNRERGYGVKNMYQTQMGGNGFYVQPGNLMSPVHQENTAKVFDNAWTPAKNMMKKNPEPPTKFQKFRAEREAMNKAETNQ